MPLRHAVSGPAPHVARHPACRQTCRLAPALTCAQVAACARPGPEGAQGPITGDQGQIRPTQSPWCCHLCALQACLMMMISPLPSLAASAPACLRGLTVRCWAPSCCLLLPGRAAPWFVDAPRFARRKTECTFAAIWHPCPVGRLCRRAHPLADGLPAAKGARGWRTAFEGQRLLLRVACPGPCGGGRRGGAKCSHVLIWWRPLARCSLPPCCCRTSNSPLTTW